MKYKKDYHVCLPGKKFSYMAGYSCVNCDASVPPEKRTRHVFRSYNEAAHVWASQTLGYGSCYSMYFEGRSIYSYGSHFEIARFIAPGVVLFTTKHYSNTTASHKAAVRGALTHKTVFEVPSFDDHTANAVDFCNRITSEVTVIKKSRAMLLSRVAALRDTQKEAKRYLDAFAGYVEPKRRRILRALIREVFFTKADLAALKAKEARHNESYRISVLNRGRYGEGRAMLEALTMVAESIWGDEITELNRAAWISGDDTYRPGYDAPVMLRVVGDEIETSRGAIVPIAEARDLWGKLRARKPVHGLTIGHYTVTGVVKGNLVIGCHEIPLREVARMAVTLGLESEAA